MRILTFAVEVEAPEDNKEVSCWIELLKGNSEPKQQGAVSSAQLSNSEIEFREVSLLRDVNTVGPLDEGDYILKLSECFVMLRTVEGLVALVSYKNGTRLATVYSEMPQ